MIFVTIENENGWAYHRVYLLDLDASNDMPWENCADSTEEYFNVKLLFQYEPIEVEDMEHTELFVRGASNENHNNLQVFIVHGTKMFNWNSSTKEFKFVSRIESGIQVMNKDTFYFLKSNLDEN
jgi:hypothetical protein